MHNCKNRKLWENRSCSGRSLDQIIITLKMIFLQLKLIFRSYFFRTYYMNNVEGEDEIGMPIPNL